MEQIGNLGDLAELARDEITFSQQLMDWGFMKSSQNCAKCGSSMKMRTRNGCLMWRCRDNATDCSTRSIRSGSWYENSKLSFYKIMAIVYMHSWRYTNDQIKRELGISNHTMVDFRCFVRELGNSISENYGKIGGGGQQVQVDETAIHTRKYGRGERRREVTWIFGGYSADGRVFAKIVKDRSKTTLMKVLRENVDANSLIVSDGWKGYQGIKRHFLDHQIVNHSKEFKNQDGYHTNGIESFWSRLKRPLKIGNGTSEQMLPIFVGDMVAKENEQENYIDKILEKIKQKIN